MGKTISFYADTKTEHILWRMERIWEKEAVGRRTKRYLRSRYIREAIQRFDANYAENRRVMAQQALTKAVDEMNAILRLEKTPRTIEYCLRPLKREEKEKKTKKIEDEKKVAETIIRALGGKKNEV